jgi:hypothetical protein
MKRTLHITLIFCIAIAVIAGCRKPNNSRTTDINTGPISTGGQPPTFPGGTQPSLNQLFKELRYTPEVKCVTAGILQVVTFSKGTSLTFYPNSFKNAAGTTITSGTVCIEMIEMYKPGDMIANGATTTATNGGLLRSGGQVHINATMDGQKVYVNKYGITFKQPTASTESMYLYYGNTDNKDSVVTWTLGDTTGSGVTATGTMVDTSTAYHQYVFDSCTDFSWINCDRFYYDPAPKTTIKIIMPNAHHNGTTSRVYFVFPSINSATQAGMYYSSTNTVELGGSYAVPTGILFHLIVMTKIADDYYYYELKDQTVTMDMTINADMSLHSLSYVQGKLTEL